MYLAILVRQCERAARGSGVSVNGEVCVFWFQKGFRDVETGQVGLAVSTFSTSWATMKITWQKVMLFDAAGWRIQRFVAEGETDGARLNSCGLKKGRYSLSARTTRLGPRALSRPDQSD